MRLFLAWVFAIVSICLAAVFFFDSQFFRISSVIVQGGTAPIDEEVQSIVYDSTKGDNFWFIPDDSFFFFPSAKLSKSILAEFPTVASVSFDRKGLTAIAIRLGMRSPYATVCLGSLNEHCYFSDENGVIFETASATTAPSFTMYHISLPNNANPIGVDFLDRGRLDALSAFVADLSKLGFADNDITIPGSANYDLSLVSTKGDPSASSSAEPSMHLFIDESKPFGDTLQDFSAFWQEYMSKATSSSARDLSSVDMRYGENIIYKIR